MAQQLAPVAGEHVHVGVLGEELGDRGRTSVVELRREERHVGGERGDDPGRADAGARSDLATRSRLRDAAST